MEQRKVHLTRSEKGPYQMARVLGKRALFTERQEGQMQLCRGFQIAPQERVLVVEDVVTTGGSAK